MPNRITPLDITAYASPETYQLGEQLFNKGCVRHRFQTLYGLQGTVRAKRPYRVEMIVDGEQLFGRCNCPNGGAHCEHQVAVLLSWVNEPSTFVSYQALRKSIRSRDKNELVDLLVNLIEIRPEMSQFFITPPHLDELAAIREQVADEFDFPPGAKIDPQIIVEACQVLFVQAKMLRTSGKWNAARTLFFELLHRCLALIDHIQIIKPFPENFIIDLADDYEDDAVNDPDFSAHLSQIGKEVKQLLEHESAEAEGVLLETIRQKVNEAKKK